MNTYSGFRHRYGDTWEVAVQHLVVLGVKSLRTTGLDDSLVPKILHFTIALTD